MDNNQSIPMRDLERLTGFSRATIGFYIKEGLLPPPEKSAKNMAYYNEKFISRLKLIQKLKDAGLSLTQMKQVMSNRRALIDINPLLNSIRSMNRLLPLGSIDQPVSIQQIRESGVDDDMIRQLTELSVISPVDPSGTLFSSYSLTICKLAKYFLNFGLPMSVIRDFVQKMRELITIENNAFTKYIKQKDQENMTDAEKEKLILECFENINTLLPLLHLQLLTSQR